jgi:hypothetical protein
MYALISSVDKSTSSACVTWADNNDGFVNTDDGAAALRSTVADSKLAIVSLLTRSKSSRFKQSATSLERCPEKKYLMIR